MTTWWSTQPVAALHLPAAFTILPTLSCKAAAELMDAKGYVRTYHVIFLYDQFPVVDVSGTLHGVVTNGQILSKLASGRLAAKDPVARGMFQQFARVTSTTALGELAELFDKEFFAVVQGDNGALHIATRIDLLNFITTNEQQ
ncbi:hypothetical protein AaE_011460 [Aphanomyces astaci]|uniref:CBS domain-containing protein n=4 Tax=Aphanomyces astaci TaxID=112090 RepID=A0A6A4ZPL8_APHAT|nr:hypothetical protein AaE_011460 [Aphanomyces astaci]